MTKRTASKVEQPETCELSSEQMLNVLTAQLNVAVNAFGKLAQARAADRVRFNEIGWDQGTEYINNELAGLHAQIAAQRPQGQA